MNNVLDAVIKFISIQDWRLVIAGFGMIVIFLLMIYLISLIVLSFQRRRDAVDVKLPDIDNQYGEKDKKATFKEIESLEVELVDSNEDLINTDRKDHNEEAFLTALSLESKRFVPLDYKKFEMPVLGEIDYESIKRRMEAEAENKIRENLERLRKIAESDERDFVDMSLINNGGADENDKRDS